MSRRRAVAGTLALLQLILSICPANAFIPSSNCVRARLPMISPSVSVHPPPTTVASRKSVVMEAAAAAQAHGGLALAGKIAPFLSKFAIDKKIGGKIVAALSETIHPIDILILAYVGWGAKPLVRFVYETFFEKWRKKDFDKTYLFSVHKLASEVSRIAAFVYAIDCLDVTMAVMGFKLSIKYNFGLIAAHVFYPVWVGRKISDWKKIYLRNQIAKVKGGNKSGKRFLYNRIFDVLITLATFLTITDRLNIEMGKAMSSVLALGSVGTLVISLASKTIAEQFVSGLALSTTDKFYEGDEILMGDGTNGIIQHVGWMTTDIRKFDEIIVRIPNSQIASQRLANMSRLKYAAVKQTLHFRYEDIDKIPKLIDDIKSQVRKACPKLITDGSRPFRAHWREFGGDHVKVVVDFHFNMRPIGDGYYDERERCLLAIAKAAKMNDIEFAIPAIVNYNNN